MFSTVFIDPETSIKVWQHFTYGHSKGRKGQGSPHFISPCPSTLQNCSEYFRCWRSTLCKQKDGTTIRYDHNLAILIQIQYSNPAVANPWWYKWKEWTTDPWSYLEASWSLRFDYPSFRARLAFGIAPKKAVFKNMASVSMPWKILFSVVFDSFILNCTLFDNCSFHPWILTELSPGKVMRCK